MIIIFCASTNLFVFFLPCFPWKCCKSYARLTRENLCVLHSFVILLWPVVLYKTSKIKLTFWFICFHSKLSQMSSFIHWLLEGFFSFLYVYIMFMHTFVLFLNLAVHTHTDTFIWHIKRWNGRGAKGTLFSKRGNYIWIFYIFFLFGWCSKCIGTMLTMFL